jgi:small subunit ribosomal protein S16
VQPLSLRSLQPVTDSLEYTMVVIRLSRGGSKRRPFYNLVAANSANRRDGRFLERVGFYNHWVAHGAQLSPTVARLVKEAKSKAAPAA